MPDEIKTSTVDQVPQDQLPTGGEQSNVAPNLDAELDEALNNSFKHLDLKITPNEEKQNKEPEKTDEKVVSKEQAKDKKADTKVQAQQEKPSLSVEEIEKMEPKKQEAWTALKNNNKRSHSIIEQKETEIIKLKSEVAEKGSSTQKEVDALKSQIEELSKYRAMIDIQADPDFISKFDGPIEKTVGSLKEMLGSMNVSQDVINNIDFTNTKLMDEIIGHVGEHRDKFLARKLQRKVEELVDLSDKRDETLSEHKSKYKEHLEARKKEGFSKQVEDEGRMLRHLDAVKAAKDKEGNNMFPFLNPITPKEGATQPEVDQINSHNRMVELMGQKVQSVLKMNTPEEKTEAAVAAVAAHYLNAQLKAASTKIRSLEEEIKKISNVSSETEKAKVPTKRNNNGNQDLDLDSALAGHFSNR